MSPSNNWRRAALSLAVGALASLSAIAEDPYLQSDGTQYIDTGYVGKPTTRIELDMQLLTANTGGDQYFFGWHGTTVGRLYMSSYTDKNGKYCYNCLSNKCNWVNTSLLTSTDRRTVVLDAYNSVYRVLDSEGVELLSHAIPGNHSGGTVVGTMPVFASRGDNSSITGKAAFRLFACRIYEADVLVHDFVPCLWNGSYGLRDVKTGSFRLPTLASGGSDLTAGGDIQEGDDPYLQSDGTQFIDTRYYATSNTCVEIDVALINTNTGKDQYLFGVGWDSGVNPLYIGMYVGSSSGSLGWNFMRGGGNWGGVGVATTTDRRVYTFDGYNNRVKVRRFNRSLVDKAMDTDHADAVTPQTMTVFGYRNGGLNATSLTAMKLYGMKIYESGELVRNFVPCRKGGAPGLYDTCSGLFQTDWKTNVAARLVLHGDYMTLPDDPHIYGDGSVYVDTGYKANVHTRIELDYQFGEESIMTGRSRYLFGPSYVDANSLSFCGYVSDKDYYGYCSKKGEQNWSGGLGTPTLARERFILDMTGTAARYISGTCYANNAFTPNYTDEDTAESYHTVTLFCNRSGGSAAASAASAITAMRFYGCRIYETNTLVRNYIPYVKDSLAGLKDTVTGTFLQPKSTKGQTRTFVACGDVEAEEEEGAYLLSDGTQAINTGYLPKPTSRIEVDFALVEHSGYGERIFGTTAGGALRVGLYGSGTSAGGGEFYFGYGNDEVKNQAVTDGTSSSVNVKRHKFTVDFTDTTGGSYGTYYFTTGEAEYSDGLWYHVTADGTWPLGLFAEPADAEFATAQNFAKMKLYSAKIYEDGVLVHHYLPCGTGAAPGLRDLVTGDVLTDCAGSATPFAVGGRGFGDGLEAFAQSPTNTVIEWNEQTATLSAFAPGAVAYQWLADGVPIAGETGDSLTVNWRRGGDSVEYSVRATFNRYGLETYVTSSPATVTRRPRGSVIILL